MVLSTQLGNAAAGAFQAMLSIHNLAFALSMGFGSAAGVRVGNAVGAGEREQAWPRALIAGGLAGLMLGAAVAAARARRAAGGLALLRRSRGAARSPPRCWRSWPPSCCSTACNMCSAPALRSLGEQVWAGVNGIIGFFLVTGGLGWLLVRGGWGPDGLA